MNVLVYWNTAASRYSTAVWTRVAPAHVKLSYSSSSGPYCSDSWYVPVASDAATDANGSLANVGQPFATTSTSGSTASGSGYTSSYAVCADYNGYENFATSVTNSNFVSPTTVTIQINQYTNTRTTC